MSTCISLSNHSPVGKDHSIDPFGKMSRTSNSLGGSRVQKFHKQQPIEVQTWIPYQVYDFDMNIKMISEVVAAIFEASIRISITKIECFAPLGRHQFL